MPESAEELVARIRTLTQPGVRGRLAARGLARGMIWRNGNLPAGSPAFGAELTGELLDQGYNLLSLALRARDLGVDVIDSSRGLLIAAEVIESAVRKGPHNDPERGFHLVVSAAAYHLGQYAARSFCLLADDTRVLNLSTSERALTALLRGNLARLRSLCIEWLSDPESSDEVVAGRLSDVQDPFSVADAEIVALTAAVLRGLALFDSAIGKGDESVLANARERLADAARASSERRYVPMWWTAELANHVVEGIWENSLHNVLSPTIDAPVDEAALWGTLRRRFIGLLAARPSSEIELWPSQVDAARRSINPADDLIVALPTSAGKTRIAELCILRCLASGKRVIYVTPLRALSAQVERGLSRTFSPLGFTVTALYGASGVAVADIGTLESASIVVATPEKLDFAIRQQPAVIDDVGLIIMDEGHMIGPNERELRYEVLVQRLLRRSDASNRRLVCLSAVFSQSAAFDDFTKWLRADAPGQAIMSEWRPTRQRSATLLWNDPNARLNVTVDDESPYIGRFFSAEHPVGRRRTHFPHNAEEFTIAAAKAFLADNQRVLIYCPLRSSVENVADAYLTLYRQGYCPSYLPDGVDLTRAIAVGEEWLGPDHVAVRCLVLGVAVHHAALPRAFLYEIEDLLSRRKLHFTIASPTLAQGIDLSCSVLIFRSIYRSRSTIAPEEYANVIGRAGRAFVDLDGLTVFPVYESLPSKRRYQLNVYRELQSEARQSHLESGIVTLVATLVDVMVRYTGATFDEIIEYVTNTEGPWTVQAMLGENDPPARPIDAEFDEAVYVESALESLDTALLTTIEQHDIDISRVTESLDSALQSSFWARRLERRTPEDAALQKAILRGRARWLWLNTDASQRRGFYAAGVGYRTGSLLDSQLPLLLQLLRTAESALSAGALADATAAITQFADVVGEIPTFSAKHRPKTWRDLLGRWVSGLSLPAILVDPSSEVSYIQDAVVYKLVWAVEAVRVQGLARAIPDAEAVTGGLALCLTYGLPTVQGALLAQAGLSSRAMVTAILSTLSPTFADSGAMRTWLRDAEVLGTVRGLWTTAGQRRIWDDFFRRWVEDGSSAWDEWAQRVLPTWLAATPPDGTEVRLIHDSETAITAVCDLELRKLGHLQSAFDPAGIGTVLGEVAGGGAWITARHFGPRSSSRI